MFIILATHTVRHVHKHIHTCTHTPKHTHHEHTAGRTKSSRLHTMHHVTPLAACPKHHAPVPRAPNKGKHHACPPQPLLIRSNACLECVPSEGRLLLNSHPRCGARIQASHENVEATMHMATPSSQTTLTTQCNRMRKPKNRRDGRGRAGGGTGKEMGS